MRQHYQMIANLDDYRSGMPVALYARQPGTVFENIGLIVTSLRFRESVPQSSRARA